MNPAKQKADELIAQFHKVTISFHFIDGGKSKAIECAIIAVEEIINLDVVWYDEEFINCKPEQTLEFWEEVLNELKSRQ